MTDEQLLREMRKGNQEALQQMIQRYHRYLTTIIGNILGSDGSREDIEELVQDTFYAVWNRAGEIRGPLKPYLCTAARNRAKSHLRKNRPQFSGRDLVEVPDELSNLEESAIRADLAQRVRAAIDRMRPRDREIFLRTYYYLQNSQEVAQEMGLSPNTVRSCLLRGRKVLQRTLGKKGIL